MPNGVIKGINLRQALICRTYHGIFIRYNHHSVMKLLITTDRCCDMGMRQSLPSRGTTWKCPIILSVEVWSCILCNEMFAVNYYSVTFDENLATVSVRH